MRKIQFQKDLTAPALLQLITSHIIHGFYYTIISRKVFGLVAEYDISIQVSDMREEGLGYVWYSYNNLIYLVTDDDLKDNELIFLKEDDIPTLMRNKKIKRLKSLLSS